MSHTLRAIILASLALSAAGCNTLTDRQRLLLTSGEQAFQAKQYDTARRHLSQFLAEMKGRLEVTRALYVRGMASALSGRRDEAYADLRRAANETTDPQTNWQPLVVLGVMCFEDENWTGATQSLGEAVARMPNAPPKDAVWYRLGMCYERMGRWDEALGPYRRIVNEYPQGPYAKHAARRLQLRASCFAVQCGVFSRADNAEQVVSRLQRAGLHPYIRQESRDGKTSCVVLEGRYGSYAQAIQALACVRGYLPEAVIWP